jgi:hypothetical protein
MDLIPRQERMMEERMMEERMGEPRMTGHGPDESPVGERRIEVEVRELVFHGFSAAEARRMAASLEEELAKYLVREFSGELPRDVDGNLAPRLAEGIRKALGEELGNHRSGTYRREHHGT